MAMYGIVDIKMRMLNIPELLAIQGFPSTYRLMGNTTQKKKCIGNAVEVTVGKCLFRALDAAIQGMEENVMVS
jgi:DNA (cytosine-5)-methyltransferase 1